MKKIPPSRWLFYGLRLILAIIFPPVYFMLRRRWKVAISLTILMIALANWHRYVIVFAVILAVIGEIVQIITDLTYGVDQNDTQPPTALPRKPLE
ncbi:hypothetical protein [Spirosoma endophyticum]|uniref:Uncharacterized protein n=1 Tax=Spirosoma endophyticum TaxID=662367 RepID=A0A1I2BMU2_9BACT|nr:hypothetical protein [Spirosoma endophyticum]SFE57108.1 hypothetical protein SAMN05216167_115142 [Spirosoma endophyticum]